MAKGIALTMNMMVLIVMVVVVVFILFTIFAGIGAESGPASNSFFYGIFDAILRSLPWVNA